MPARLEKKRSRNSEGAGMTTPAAKWKAAERARHKEAGRVAVTHYIYPADRAKVARYIKRLNERSLTTYTETPPHRTTTATQAISTSLVCR